MVKLKKEKLNEEQVEKLLRELLNNSYCTYSKFKVSALITMKDGNYFLGVNVENAAYGSTICAERSAICAAVSYGYKRGDFDKLYCMTGNVVENESKVSASCGACLQVMSEFFDEDAECTFMDYEGKKRTFTLAQMLPYAFTIKDLQIEEDKNLKNNNKYNPVSKEEFKK